FRSPPFCSPQQGPSVFAIGLLLASAGRLAAGQTQRRRLRREAEADGYVLLYPELCQREGGLVVKPITGRNRRAPSDVVTRICVCMLPTGLRAASFTSSSSVGDAAPAAAVFRGVAEVPIPAGDSVRFGAIRRAESQGASQETFRFF